MRKVYQIVDGMEAESNFCEFCVPKIGCDIKIYITAPYNPEIPSHVFYCERCIKEHDMEVIGWLTEDEWWELKEKFELDART